MTHLDCTFNSLTMLDLSNNLNLTVLSIGNNDDLNYVNLKNGNNENLAQNSINFENLPILEYICVDDVNLDLTTYIADQVGHPVTFTEFCSFSPSLNNEINGVVLLNVDANGCNASDLSMPSIMVNTTNGTESFATFTQSNGGYLLFTNEGVFSTLVTTNLPNYFTINPNTHTNTFVGFENTFIADFCIEPNQTINDVSITLLPTSQARPGFEARYQIIYKNIGTTQLSGDIILEFDDASLSFLSASENVDSQTSNSLTFNYSNLNQFESRTISLEFNVFTPPTVEIGDVLTFTTTINPFAGDNTPDDNIYNLDQTVVGSYDPNDITCLEGNQILIEDVDEYLHYIIRFQNMGTASAINVVVTNVLDDNLDWPTLELESISHSNRVAITNGNDIDFIFENINLPESNTNEPDSHGFIAYKIKPKTDIQVGDIISNTADIFFDFNEAISTNIETTEIIDPDTIPPVANCQNFTVLLDTNGNTSISANDIDNGSTDNVGIVNMSVSPNTFNCNDIGNITVTLTVEDATGNTDTCEAFVTVEDNLNPEALAMDIEIDLNGNSSISITPEDIDDGSNDNCEIVNMLLSQDTFTVPGIFNIDLTVTDSSGNNDVAIFQVTAIDSSLGIVDKEISGFIMYPNPVKNSINIKIDGQLETIKLFDITGRIVKEFNSIGINNFSIQLDNLDSGIYFVFVYDNVGGKIQKRLVKY